MVGVSSFSTRALITEKECPCQHLTDTLPILPETTKEYLVLAYSYSSLNWRRKKPPYDKEDLQFLALQIWYLRDPPYTHSQPLVVETSNTGISTRSNILNLKTLVVKHIQKNRVQSILTNAITSLVPSFNVPFHACTYYTTSVAQKWPKTVAEILGPILFRIQYTYKSYMFSGKYCF